MTDFRLRGVRFALGTLRVSSAEARDIWLCTEAGRLVDSASVAASCNVESGLETELAAGCYRRLRRLVPQRCAKPRRRIGDAKHGR
jgi:hypothetical protein